VWLGCITSFQSVEYQPSLLGKPAKKESGLGGRSLALRKLAECDSRKKHGSTPLGLAASWGQRRPPVVAGSNPNINKIGAESMGGGA